MTAPHPQRPRRKLLRRLIAVGVVAACLVVLLLLVLPHGKQPYQGAVHTVGTRDILINVVESGNFEATNALDIKSKVEGRATILSIVPDGAILTEKDVQDGRVLVQLDASELREREAQQEITFQGAQADYTQAKESYEIQKNLNASSIREGELKVKFARMDFEKYLGADLAGRILKGEASLSDLVLGEVSVEQADKRLKLLNIGGAALQEWQRLQSDVYLADENLRLATKEYEWSVKLGPKPAGKGYISAKDVETDELKVAAQKAALEQKQRAMLIFLLYDQPKNAEKLYSDHVEAQAELERIHTKARAEIAKAESQLMAREAALRLQKDRLDKLHTQVANCTIRAPRAGMVVYASTSNPRGRQEEIIEEGTSVREQQLILRIPDPKGMSVKAKISESHINKLRRGQKARVTPEPFPDMVLWGTVRRVADAPDMSSWFTPDVRAYVTEIVLDSPPEELKPGMTAKVEILVDRVENVVAVPVQAVSAFEGIRICYVLEGSRAVVRPVETGRGNESFIEITSGIQVGEKVLLYKPETFDETTARAEIQKRKTANAAEVAAKAAETAQSVAAAAANPNGNSNGEAGEKPADGDTPAWLAQVPEQYREAALKRWREATPEQRAEMLKQFQERGRSGRRRPPADAPGTPAPAPAPAKDAP